LIKVGVCSRTNHQTQRPIQSQGSLAINPDSGVTTTGVFMQDQLLCDKESTGFLSEIKPTEESKVEDFLKELDQAFPDNISNDAYGLLFEELDQICLEVKSDPEETSIFLFKDGAKVYNLWVKKLQAYAIRKKYVSGVDYKPSYQVKDEAYDLASDFLTECAKKNKFAGYCDEKRLPWIRAVMFSQWMSRKREKLGKQADQRMDSRNRTLRDQKKGESNCPAQTYAFVNIEIEEGLFEKELYDPNQTSQLDELEFKTLIQSLEEIIRVECQDNADKHTLWTELLKGFVETKVFNLKRHSDTTWAQTLGIPLKDLRNQKTQMKRALRKNLVV